MSRDANGNYTLPIGNPVITDTIIDSEWANDTAGDLGNEITNSLDRYGKGGMVAPFRVPNGTKALPTLSFNAETSSGLYRAADGQLRISIKGNDALSLIEGVPVQFLGGSFSQTGGAITISSGALTLNGGTVVATGGTFRMLQGTVTFNGDGLFQEGTDLYLGVDNTAPKVLTADNITAREIPFDNSVEGTLPAANVQAAIDQLTVLSPVDYGSLAYNGGGPLAAGVFNRLLDSSVYTLPQASSTQNGALIWIAVPSTASGETPSVNAFAGDNITWEAGSDTSLAFASPATISLASNGVDTWEY